MAKTITERSKRLSVDLDKHHMVDDEFSLLRPYFAMKSCLRKSRITVEKTGHGFHVKAVGKEVADIPLEKRLDIREVLGDDAARIEWDRSRVRRGCPQNCETLFTMKTGPDHKTFITYPVDAVSLPFASVLPAFKVGKRRHRRA